MLKLNNIFQKNDNLEIILQTLLNKITLKMKLEDIINIYSNSIDEFILKTEKESKLNFIGGKLKLQLMEKEMLINVECYFQDQNKTWVKKYSYNKIEVNRIEEESLSKFKDANVIEFDIETPLKSNERN